MKFPRPLRHLRRRNRRRPLRNRRSRSHRRVTARNRRSLRPAAQKTLPRLQPAMLRLPRPILRRVRRRAPLTPPSPPTLAATAKNLKSVNRKLTHAEQAMVAQIKTYIDQSRKATSDNDFERAYNLANKARLLSDRKSTRLNSSHANISY